MGGFQKNIGKERPIDQRILQITFVALQLHDKKLCHLNQYDEGQWVENKTSQKEKIFY